MKPFSFPRKREMQGGFSLVEATLSLGLLSFGFLTLASLLALGLNTARAAHANRDSTQIAQSLIEDAKQGTLSAGIAYLDFQGNPVDRIRAAYATQTTFSSIPGNSTLTRLTLQVTPIGAPDRARIYAVVICEP